MIHNAALISVPESDDKPELYNYVNVKGTENVLKASLECGLKKVVFASSAAVYGDAECPVNEDTELNPLSVYAANKISGENLCMNSEVKTVVFRYFNVFGPGQSKEYAGVISKFIEQKKKVKHQ